MRATSVAVTAGLVLGVAWSASAVADELRWIDKSQDNATDVQELRAAREEYIEHTGRDDWHEWGGYAYPGKLHTAYRIWLPFAKAGNALAELELGIFLLANYYRTDELEEPIAGMTPEENFHLAWSWLRKAALNGQNLAARTLSRSYGSGNEGLPKNHGLSDCWKLAFDVPQDLKKVETSDFVNEDQILQCQRLEEELGIWDGNSCLLCREPGSP